MIANRIPKERLSELAASIGPVPPDRTWWEHVVRSIEDALHIDEINEYQLEAEQLVPEA